MEVRTQLPELEGIRRTELSTVEKETQGFLHLSLLQGTNHSSMGPSLHAGTDKERHPSSRSKHMCVLGTLMQGPWDGQRLSLSVLGLEVRCWPRQCWGEVSMAVFVDVFARHGYFLLLPGAT